jgi:hypothetical protein
MYLYASRSAWRSQGVFVCLLACLLVCLFVSLIVVFNCLKVCCFIVVARTQGHLPLMGWRRISNKLEVYIKDAEGRAATVLQSKGVKGNSDFQTLLMSMVQRGSAIRQLLQRMSEMRPKHGWNMVLRLAASLNEDIDNNLEKLPVSVYKKWRSDFSKTQTISRKQ